MLRRLKGTDFIIGSFVDAGIPDRQEKAGVRCVLKCTNQPIDGKAEMRFPFHHPSGYLNLEFADNGACDVGVGENGFLWAKNWLRGAESIIKDEGKGKIMVQSWSGNGKAARLLAAYLCGWVRSQFKESLARVYQDAEIDKKIRVDLPEFEAALLDTMDDDPPIEGSPQGAPPAEGKKPAKKKKKRKTQRPQLDK